MPRASSLPIFAAVFLVVALVLFAVVLGRQAFDAGAEALFFYFGRAQVPFWSFRVSGREVGRGGGRAML